MVDSDTFNRIMDDVNPENIDNELRKFYLYSACGGNRPELVKKFSGGGIDTNFCVDCYNNFLEYGDPVVSRKILKMLEKNTKLDIGGYQLENPRPTPLNPNQLNNDRMESDFATYIREKDDLEEKNKLRVKDLILNDKKNLCHLFLKHIDDCDTCKEKMAQRFGSQMMEKFENLAGRKRTPNYFEILMIILVGIIIIVIMDSFVRLGKMMRK